MKSTSLSSEETSVLFRKLLLFRDQVKQIQLSEILSCLFAGIITHGTLFGVVRPFGAAYYSVYSKGIVQKTLMTLCIFTGSILRGDLLAALKQIAVIFLYEWFKKLLLPNGKDISPLKNSIFIGSASVITGVFVFLIEGQTLELLLVLLMEAILVSVLSSIIFHNLLRRRHGQCRISRPQKSGVFRFTGISRRVSFRCG